MGLFQFGQQIFIFFSLTRKKSHTGHPHTRPPPVETMDAQKTPPPQSPPSKGSGRGSIEPTGKNQTQPPREEYGPTHNETITHLPNNESHGTTTGDAHDIVHDTGTDNNTTGNGGGQASAMAVPAPPRRNVVGPTRYYFNCGGFCLHFDIFCSLFFVPLLCSLSHRRNHVLHPLNTCPQRVVNERFDPEQMRD